MGLFSLIKLLIFLRPYFWYKCTRGTGIWLTLSRVIACFMSGVLTLWIVFQMIGSDMYSRYIGPFGLSRTHDMDICSVFTFHGSCRILLLLE